MKSEVFAGLQSLKYLNISYNFLDAFPRDVLGNAHKLETRSLYHNELCSLEASAFDHNFVLEILETNDDHLCCFVSSVTKGHAEVPWYVSCSDLLPNTAMKMCFITISACVLWLGVLFSVALSIVSKPEINKSNVVLSVSIDICEFSVAIFLSLLWIYDVTFKGSFSLKRKLFSTTIRTGMNNCRTFLSVLEKKTQKRLSSFFFVSTNVLTQSQRKKQ